MSDEEKGVEALRAELELHKAELKKLHDQINPPKSEPYVYQPVDYTANMKMPANALAAMVDASSSYMADLRSDARKQNPVTGGPNPGPQPQVRRGSGWRDEIPLSSPPGIALADRLVDAQDRIDKVELAQKLAKARMGKGDVK